MTERVNKLVTYAHWRNTLEIKMSLGSRDGTKTQHCETHTHTHIHTHTHTEQSCTYMTIAIYHVVLRRKLEMIQKAIKIILDSRTR